MSGVAKVTTIHPPRRTTKNSQRRRLPAGACEMPSSTKSDYDALEEITKIEDMVVDELNQGTLRLLKYDELSYLRLCAEDVDDDILELGDYQPGSNEEELGWRLGHFVKKSSHLEQFLMHGNGNKFSDIFANCSEQSVYL